MRTGCSRLPAGTIAPRLSPGSPNSRSCGNTGKFVSIHNYGRSYSPEALNLHVTVCPGLLDIGSLTSCRKLDSSVSANWRRSPFLIIFSCQITHYRCIIMYMICPRLYHVMLIRVEVVLLQWTRMAKSNKTIDTLKYGGIRFIPLSLADIQTSSSPPHLNASPCRKVSLATYVSYSEPQISISLPSSVIQLRGSESSLV